MISVFIDKSTYPYGKCTLDGNGETVIQEFYNLNIMLIKSILDPCPQAEKEWMYKNILRKAMVESFKYAGKELFCRKEEADEDGNEAVAP